MTPMSSGQTIIVDAYNVIYQSPPMRECLLRSRESARANLVSFCTEWLSRRRDVREFWVVFDGDPTVGPVASAAAPRNIRVIYAPTGEKADGRILELIERSEDPAGCVAVTADNRVADGARRRGAQVWSPSRFLGTLRPASRPTGGQSPDDGKNGLSAIDRKRITDEMQRLFGAS